MPSCDIFESVKVPAGGHSFVDGKDTSGLVLPNYQKFGLSLISPLTLTDSHLAMLTAIHKARLIGFEIARRNKHFIKRRSREITLQGDPREFDIILSSTGDNFKDALSIESIARLDRRLITVLVNPLVVHKDFKDSSVRLKRLLMRIEKKFGQNVIEPLKKAMINKSKPAFPDLIGQATHCQQETMRVCNVWQKEVEEVCTKIKATEGWHEATELNKEIESLEKRAEAMGWKSWKDKKFAELDPNDPFCRADGPSSVIAYLEGMLKDVK